jgi:hypothetical protein
MNSKKIYGFMLMSPLIFLIIGSFITVILLSYFNLETLGWSTPLIFGIIILLFVIGHYMIIDKNGNN